MLASFFSTSLTNFEHNEKTPDVFVESKRPKYTPLKYVLIGVTFTAMDLQFVSLSPF